MRVFILLLLLIGLSALGFTRYRERLAERFPWLPGMKGTPVAAPAPVPPQPQPLPPPPDSPVPAAPPAQVASFLEEARKNWQDPDQAETLLRQAYRQSDPNSRPALEAAELMVKLLSEQPYRKRSELTWRLRLPLSPEDEQAIQAEIEQLNAKFFSPAATPEDATVYEVQSGDHLGKIAKQFGVTHDGIRLLNGIPPEKDVIVPGQRLKIPKGKISIRVDKGNRTLVLYLDEKLLKRYPVGIGKDDRTPVGSFSVKDRVPQPPWYRELGKPPILPGDPRNILGSHWLGLKVPIELGSGYGIHGTTDESSIGQETSNGCVRMRNRDVAEVFALAPVGTPVEIR
jgi:lipoprotein-anchoring transpeptidase ErfK/SrfK